MNETLLQEFDRLLQEKTFSVDAAAGIAALKEKVEKQSEELEYSRTRHTELLAELNSSKAECYDLREKLSGLEEKLKAANDEIESMKPAHYEAQKEKAVSEAYKFCLETVFKPAALRRTVQESVVMPPPTVHNGMTYFPGTTPVSSTTIEAEE